MDNIDKICVSSITTIRDAIERMNSSGRQIILVVDEKKKLLGTFTDGDLRRALIKGADIDMSIEPFFNRKPHTSPASKGRAGAVERMREFGIDQMPLVDDDGVVKKLEAINPAQYGLKIDNPVVIMAGGMGKRLYPITKDTPKGLIPVGDRPILEIILERLITQGFQKFIFAIHHFGNVIEDYFGNGERWNVHIDYLREEKRLGTAGALSLFVTMPEMPFIVMNCDILTTTNFQDMLEFHESEKSIITMGVRESVYQIPYGVIEVNDSRLKCINEKPEHKFYVNTGMYCLSPEALEYIPVAQFFDMTDLIDRLLEYHKPVSCYEIKKYWIDIGQHEDLEKARSEYHLYL